MKTLNRGVVRTIAVLGIVFPSLLQFSANAADVGSPAPDFSLIDPSGQKHTLSDFKGKFVVLEWMNYGCPFIRKHYDSGNMQSLQKEFTGKDVVWLSICSSAPGKQGYYTAEEWPALIKSRHASSTALLLDSDGRVGKMYGAKTTPHMFVIDKEGVLIYQGAIDDKASTDQADIASAHNYVRAALESAMEGKPVATTVTIPYGCGVKY